MRTRATMMQSASASLTIPALPQALIRYNLPHYFCNFALSSAGRN